MAKRSRDTATERSRERLPVPLTDDEVLAHADQAARLQAEADAWAEALAEESKERRAEIAEMRARAKEHLRLVRERREERQVEVELVRDFPANAVRVVRLDTGEVVRQRPMTAEERQEQLFAIDAPAEREKKDAKK